MFNIRFNTWKEVIRLYSEVPDSIKRQYLQWYPFTKSLELRKLYSKSYFKENIKKGIFITDEVTMSIPSNYMQKSNGQYRQSQLLSPILYLVLQCACFDLSEYIQVPRYSEISVYYSGSIENKKVFYRDEYSNFYKEINYWKNNYDYYIKLDAENYFANIDIDVLFSKIESYSTELNQIDLLMFKELISYVGRGSFPLIENSVGTSYLATEVYLAEIDNAIYDYLEKDNNIEGFKIIRYVDDLYILFNSYRDQLNRDIFIDEFLKYVGTVSNKSKLHLNQSKTSHGISGNVSKELYAAFYDEFVNGEEFDIYDITQDQQESLLLEFLTKLSEEIYERSFINHTEFMEIINNVFSLEESSLSPREILNRVLYSNIIDFGKEEIKSKTIYLSDKPIIYHNPKLFMTLILETKDGQEIRNVLNSLFNKSRDSGWIMNETEVAIRYLLARNFKHKDLLDALSREVNDESRLINYIKSYCQPLPWEFNRTKAIEDLQRTEVSGLTFKILFLYLVNKDRDDYFAAYSYYKSFFDRITAEISYSYDLNKEVSKNKSSKPNYKMFHDNKNLIKVYKAIDKSEEIIKEASKYRNFNPINHGSAELLTKQHITKGVLEKSIKKLNNLLENLIKEVSD